VVFRTGPKIIATLRETNVVKSAGYYCFAFKRIYTVTSLKLRTVTECIGFQIWFLKGWKIEEMQF